LFEPLVSCDPAEPASLLSCDPAEPASLLSCDPASLLVPWSVGSWVEAAGVAFARTSSDTVFAAGACSASGCAASGAKAPLAGVPSVGV